MLRLPNTGTYSLELVTAQNGANVYVTFSDATATGYSGGAQTTAVTSATTTTICDTPASGTVRDVDFISVRNTYAGTHLVSIQIDVNGTNIPVFGASLAEGQSLTYTHGSGWLIGALNGASGGAVVAADVGFTPVGDIAATDVQAAIEELDGEKEPADATILKEADIGTSVQAQLVSGTSIKTVNGETLLGSGDVQLAGAKNKAINGRFQINQRAYASGATLAAGVYGHDRWKAGASGGDYSFTQNAASTTITIASGKTLIQVIEGGNASATSFVLSWTGTAQGRYAVNSATPSGAYADSPVLITGQTVGSVMSIEFDDGTLGNVQLEPGTSNTSYEARGIGSELALCYRYYWRKTFSASDIVAQLTAYNTTSAWGAAVSAPVTMRAKPTSVGSSAVGTFNLFNATGTGAAATTTLTFAAQDDGSVRVTQIDRTGGGLVAGNTVIMSANAAAYIESSAEL